MLKETITYIDYNGVERTQDFYFNLTEAEILELEMGTTGGFVEMLNTIVAAKDAPTIIDTFKKIILKAYGEKAPDGIHFLKEDDNGRLLANKFKQTEAYSKLFMKLATDADAASKFVNGIVPAPKQA